MYFDTHAHYDDEMFDGDREWLLDRALPENGVALVLNPGCERRSSLFAVELSEKYDYVYAAAGWHPSDAASFDESSETLIRELCGKKKVRAIGEIGLDYHYGADTKETQQKVLRRQLAIARELGKPVIIHDRDAHADCMAILAEYPEVKGVFHCYSGSAEMAAELVRRGWYLSFTGAITFKNARRAQEVITSVPLDRIMIETDSPYLAPVPNRGHRNDSSNLPYIAERIAELRGMTVGAVAELTMENGRRFFDI